jgi:plasmid stabilization system protein ParE
MSIKWTKTALRSADEIASYIAKHNPTRASSFVIELQDAVTKLQLHPGMGRAGRVPGTRELVLLKKLQRRLRPMPVSRWRGCGSPWRKLRRVYLLRYTTRCKSQFGDVVVQLEV